MTNDLTTLTNWEDIAGAGYESTGTEDLGRIFVKILQDLSPPVKERRMDIGNFWITGADIEIPGSTGFTFIPVFTEQQWVEFTPREAGAEFVATHAQDSDVVKVSRSNGEFGKYTTQNGNNLVQTFFLYMLIEHEDGIIPAVFPLKSTHIKAYNGLRSKLNMLRMPNGKPYALFAHRCRATTAKAVKGRNEYFEPRFALDGKNAEESRVEFGSPTFHQAYEMYKLCSSGVVKIDHQEEDSAFAGFNAEDDRLKDANF